MGTSILTRRLLLSALSIPAGALLLTAYLYNHPLPASKSRTITAYNALSPTTAASRSIQTVNPRNHQSITDTRTIFLSASQNPGLTNLSDEEILARFMKGFYGGWIFVPERTVMGIVELVARRAVAIRAGFSGVEPKGDQIPCFSPLPRNALLPKQTPIIGGNFMILDYYIKSSPSSPDATPSFVEIGYGSDRRGFAGMHRYEVFRQPEGEKEEGGVRIGYSSISCNPMVDKAIFPWCNTKLVWDFHNLYALCLFRDGIREVLRED